ncbi:MAG: isoaspartyl peptidase/L-asparaginase [Thermodesulfovibrionales bacterium]|nr:isoaspartyl peptidase/L-asparaginase [Thermodesulfovibrionales bacterium]
MRFGIIVHGGAGSPEDWRDGCERACERGFSILRNHGSALQAVIDAVRILEDDGRFNAGTGSVVRIDGKTIEMDAAIMDSTGRIAMVIAVRDVKNPVLLAQAILNTPHVAMAGEGATLLARKYGIEPHPGPSERALENYERIKKLLSEKRAEEINPLWKGFEIFTDTVGAVAMDINGIFAVASSTGGASPMLVGRVGDTPIVGCGFYAGSMGAIAVTGIGEEIIKRMVAKKIYEMIESGMDAEKAVEKIIASFPPEIPAGIIVITKDSAIAISNRKMAWAHMFE